jgi:hypothetical protein
MDTRERIKTYAAHGGAWSYLEEELILEGFSESLAKEFCSRCRYSLGQATADIALIAYDQWKKERNEDVVKTVFALAGL